MKPAKHRAYAYYAMVPSSDFGSIIIVWSLYKSGPLIDRVMLSRPERPAERILETDYREAVASSCPEIACIIDQIQRFLKGERVFFDLTLIRLDLCSPFQRRVLRAEADIPFGSVSTYQGIARKIRQIRAVRAAGNALAGNPFPLLIPCHRAIRSDMRPGGFQGGAQMKRALLALEGNVFDCRNRLLEPKLFYPK